MIFSRTHGQVATTWWLSVVPEIVSRCPRPRTDLKLNSYGTAYVDDGIVVKQKIGAAPIVDASDYSITQMTKVGTIARGRVYVVVEDPVVVILAGIGEGIDCSPSNVLIDVVVLGPVRGAAVFE